MKASGRQSKNIIDLRDEKKTDEYEAALRVGDKHRRMIFRPDVERVMVKTANTKTVKEPLGKGPGRAKMKQPANSASATKFLPFKTLKGK